MPIMNKDGTVYLLKGPNTQPVTKPRWDMSKVILHNFDPNQPIEVETPVIEPVKLPPEPSQLPPDPEEAKVRYPPVPAPIPPEIDPLPPAPQSSLTSIHCLPGKLSTFRDRLYDENHVTLTYGSPFIFQAKIIHRGDLKFVIVSEVEISEGSILFPRSGDARWWRVNEVAKESKFFRVTCHPSEEHPSF